MCKLLSTHWVLVEWQHNLLPISVSTFIAWTRKSIFQHIATIWYHNMFICVASKVLQKALICWPLFQDSQWRPRESKLLGWSTSVHIMFLQRRFVLANLPGYEIVGFAGVWPCVYMLIVKREIMPTTAIKYFALVVVVVGGGGGGGCN